MKIHVKILVIFSIIFFSCDEEHIKPDQNDLFPYKEYSLNENGYINNTEYNSVDFHPSENCKDCHNEHYEEWTQSMHAFSMKGSMFFSGWNDAQHNYPSTGERFCVQCHNPIAFITGEDLSEYKTTQDFFNSDLPQVIKEGIGCDVCHSITSLSQTVHADDNIAASAKYYLYPGENIKFGSIQQPIQNEYHISEYNPIFKRSELCLPCHDLTVRGVEAEITFTEWNRFPSMAMAGVPSCQDCHMKVKSDGTHDHRFIGVDVDLSYPIQDNPLISEVEEMLKSAIELKFGYEDKELSDSIFFNELLNIPISIKSLTGHSLPSGTSFSREAWIEIIVTDDRDSIIFESGNLQNSSQPLDTTDSNLLLFTTTLLNEYGEVVNTVIKAHDIVNENLPTFGIRNYDYQIEGVNNTTNYLNINVRMLFRPFKPKLLLDHPHLIKNLPIYEMNYISEVVYIKKY